MFSLYWTGSMTWNVPLLVSLVLVGIVYLIFFINFTGGKLPLMQAFLFYLGLVLIYIPTGSPLSTFSHLSFTVHMIYMSILFFIVPPLILGGIPKIFQEQVKAMFLLKGKLRFIISPITSLIIFACMFLLYHLPFMFQIFLQQPSLHSGYVLLMFLLSFNVWSPLVTSDRSDKKKRYAFLSGLILMPACILFVLNGFMGKLSYPFLVDFAALCMPTEAGSFTLFPSWYNTQIDQIVAGVIMMVIHKFGIMITFMIGNQIK
ncbi:cytochrome c oxidase assembly protein [Jeotgalibacillus marinus]